MLGIEVTIAEFLVDQVSEKGFVERVEKAVKSLYGFEGKIVILANYSEADQNRLWVKGTIYPECDGEAETPDSVFEQALMNVAMAFDKQQKRYLEMDIVVGLVFCGTGNRKVTK